MTTALRLTRYGLLGFTGGALLTLGAGVVCAVVDWQRACHRAQHAGEKLQGRWLG